MTASKKQFSAAQLFYATTLMATSVAMFQLWGILCTALVLLVWYQILSGACREGSDEGAGSQTRDLVPEPAPVARTTRTTRMTRTGIARPELVVLALVGGVLVLACIPSGSDVDAMTQTSSSMQQIAQALAEYEEQHGSRPPQVVCDESGRPMHSWRALILKQLGEDQLAAAYRMDEPWDGPNNSLLARYTPWHYQIVNRSDAVPAGYTSMHMVEVNQRTLVAQQEQICGNWMQPESVNLSDWNACNEVPAIDDGFWNRGFFYSEFRGRLVASADRTWRVQPGQSLEVLDDSDQSSQEMRVVGLRHRDFHPQNLLRLLCFLCVALYPLRWLRRIHRNTGN